MDTIFWLALLLMIGGIIGSVLPVVPGPILSFAGLLVYYIFQEEKILTLGPLVFFGLGMLFLVVADYLLPLLGVKFLGASKSGQWGAIIGAILGIAFFPPLGIFLGALVGGIVGELYHGKEPQEAVKAGAGVVTGSIVAIFLQVIFSLSVIAYFLFKIIF
ncbi:MAG: hypothetical protein UR60_C0017G0021 [Candidatus Moranbacteria bacterium GW2011_GWF2_34_56]|nr:MAG: hypothetical protein UR51_C0015G0016 [Candidatus Moranbacteria bacterium GW2011_GWF1_34_10]KKP64683.1 MAG: hypothetical protein UR60_C0017G0021 [Candidatus Moranbacteria bacterium GW2011_GWF2_34_56]HBI17606.1 DUF456 domain-containing protein [Candidatus Moranbacteria bacterium]